MLKQSWKLIVLTVLCVLLFGTFAYGQQVSGEGYAFPKKPKHTITVGGEKADVPGFTNKAIQIAIDALKVRGGGTVKLMGGTFEMMAPARLATGVSLIGSGKETILHKVDGFSSPLAVGSGYGMYTAQVKDVSGFKVGMAVVVDDADNRGGFDPSVAVITAIEGNTVFFDRQMYRNYPTEKGARIWNACSIVEIEEAEDVYVADLVIDGNKSTNDRVGGAMAGGLFLKSARNCLIENVEVKNHDGDGMCLLMCKDVTVKNSEVHDCTGLGYHPGGGSYMTTIEDSSAHHNGNDGLFLCWRVQKGVFKNNKIYQNGDNGIEIGQKDTDNIFEGNHVYENGRHGVYFRKLDNEWTGNRNKFIKNTFENNGTKKEGYAFYIEAETSDIIIEDNIIRDKNDIFTAKGTSNIKVK